MKQVIYAVSMSACLALALAACDKSDKSDKKDDGKTPASQQQPAQPKTEQPVPTKGPDAAALQGMAKNMFGTLPARADKPGAPSSQALIDLGRMLYFDARLSKSQTISCNSCHGLDQFGIDVRAPEGQRQTSQGHKGQMGGRNSPTVYNAALHATQFWDGREPDVEAQAKGPVLNPIEMAMPDEAHVVAVLKSIPGYVEAFKTAFPDADKAITYDNMASAIGAFERGLITPGRFDEFAGGKLDALTEEELRGFKAFVDTGCVSCHMSATFGGTQFQKLGLIKPYETKDLGRFEVTKNEAETFFFKVPSLRNIAKTAPYLHDGSIATLEEMVAIMARHQTAAGTLSDAQVKDIVAFLNALTGDLPTEYIAEPTLPESGPKTPKPAAD